jgi:hypothetical protein
MTANDRLAKRELSAGDLESIVGGAARMSGVPNSIMGAGFPREPHLPPHFPLPRYWAGGVENSPGLRLD